MSAVHGAVVVGHGVQVVAVVALVGPLGVRAHLQPLQRKLDQRVLLPPRNVLAKPTTYTQNYHFKGVVFNLQGFPCTPL